MMHVSRGRLAAGVVVLAAAFCGAASTSCGPESVDRIPDDAATRYARKICDAYSRCDCLGVAYSDADACVGAATELFESIASAPGLAFRKSCFDEFLDYLDEVGCGPDTESAHVPCLVFEGAVASGDACTPDVDRFAEWGSTPFAGFLTVSPCEGDSPCVQGVCGGDPAAKLGDSCALSTGKFCEPDAPGQRVICGRDGTCRPSVETGGSCDIPNACASPDEYCDGVSLDDAESTGQCVARLPLGSPCDPTDVESCALGAHCGIDGTCRDRWPAVCAALTAAPGEYNPLDWLPE